ncbi:MAG: T9SS type A sorting domain-containing protein, partial [Bacteroidia bacterium]|nr:T9SS type A sorting domain-containing protein [Bacteroidia bacterium]
NGCRYDATFTQTVNNCQGISELKSDVNEFSIYPNPAESSFIVNNKNSGASELVIYDGLGKMVYRTELHPGENKIVIQLKSGVYFCQWKGENLSATKKLIISK